MENATQKLLPCPVNNPVLQAASGRARANGAVAFSQRMWEAPRLILLMVVTCFAQPAQAADPARPQKWWLGTGDRQMVLLRNPSQGGRENRIVLLALADSEPGELPSTAYAR